MKTTELDEQIARLRSRLDSFEKFASLQELALTKALEREADLEARNKKLLARAEEMASKYQNATFMLGIAMGQLTIWRERYPDPSLDEGWKDLTERVGKAYYEKEGDDAGK